MKIKELYKIVEGSNVWNITSGDASEVFGGDTYTPAAVGRSDIESKKELSRANIELSFDLDSTIARRWLNQNIDSIVSVTVWTKQDSTYIVMWKGRLTSVKPEDAQIKLVFESIFTSLRRPGLRRRFQRNCPHVLYGRGCYVNKDTFAAAGTCTAMNSNATVLTIGAAASQPNGYYLGGMVKSPDGTLRFIIGHSGSSVTLIRPIDTLTAAMAGGSQSVTLYPGCDRSRQICNDRFNNLANNGSTPFIPTRNPFNGNSFV